MERFIIEKNDFLSENVPAFYSKDYIGYKRNGNPDFLNTLKNTFNSYPSSVLNGAVIELNKVLNEVLDIAYMHSEFNFGWPLTICVIPRAKTTYSPNQLLFHSTIKSFFSKIINDLQLAQYHEIWADGTEYIKRHTNTRTTHLPTTTPNYNNDGDIPYKGITEMTCHISDEVKGKSILLIDDIYTKGINIDEDAIQALINKGAEKVIFYSVAKTLPNRNLIL